MIYSRPGMKPNPRIILDQPKPLAIVDNDPTAIADLLRRKAKDFGLTDNDLELAEAAAHEAIDKGASKEEALKRAIDVAAVLAMKTKSE